ncbi:hypothetical protein EMCRGX_G023182 [Ephydatia muelleri]
MDKVGDDNVVEDQDEGEENDEVEIYSEDDDNEIAPAGFSGYGESDLLRGAELLTGACIQKRSCLSNIMGPRNQHRSVRNPHAGPGNGQLIRQDMVAAAVRLASILITNHSVNITNGHSEMEEYNLAAHLEISEKNHNHKHQGWAWRPQRGAQYGRAYLEPYKKDIKRMFERGARVSSDKMSPCAMLEELQSLYPGRYTLPGENEIRAEITKLFGRKKASDEDNAGSDHDESENEATKGRGSNLPKQYVKHLEELVECNPTIKPAEALRNLKAALCLPHPFEHDKAIKTKVFYGFAIPPTAESLPSDSLTILQCTEDEVTIEWSIQNDLKFVAFEYSCIHPTNSTLTVRNQSLPYWNDGQTGVTMVSPPGGALCLFSACYLDNYNSRHFIAPTSCSVSSPTATQDGSSVPEQSITQQTMTSAIDLVPSPTTTPDGSISLRVRRGSLHLQQSEQSLLS